VNLHKAKTSLKRKNYQVRTRSLLDRFYCICLRTYCFSIVLKFLSQVQCKTVLLPHRPSSPDISDPYLTFYDSLKRLDTIFGDTEVSYILFRSLDMKSEVSDPLYGPREFLAQIQ